MSRDTSRTPVKPFLIETEDDGSVRLTIRATRFNSWNYPIVSSSLVEEKFATASAARAHAKKHFGAQAGQFAVK